MSNLKTLLGSLFVLLIGLSSCKKEGTEEPDFGYNYLPIDIGYTYDYLVDSIVYDEFTNTTRPFQFTLRDVCAESFQDLTGRTTYRIERSKRFNDTSGFVFQYSYTITLDKFRAERKVNNSTEVFFVFPPKPDEEWEANAFNVQASLKYSFLSVDDPWRDFDSVATVIQINDTSSLIFRTYAEERFARNVGLVYREFLDVESQFVQSLSQTVDSGLHWKQTLTQFSIQSLP